MLATKVTVQYCDSDSPRKDYNLGTFVMCHRRYSFGDENYSEDLDRPLAELAGDYMALEDLHALILEGLDKEGYACMKDEWEEDCRHAGLASLDDLSRRDFYRDWLIVISSWSNRYTSMIFERMSDHIPFLPVYMYDHSGVTISTGSFSCPWDSGCIGYIFASPDTLKENYIEVSDETKRRALEVIQSEIEILDAWLTGECYSFSIEEYDDDTDPDCHYGTVIDSCGGFLGDLETNGMLDHVDKEHHEALKKAFDNLLPYR